MIQGVCVAATQLPFEHLVKQFQHFLGMLIHSKHNCPGYDGLCHLFVALLNLVSHLDVPELVRMML